VKSLSASLSSSTKQISSDITAVKAESAAVQSALSTDVALLKGKLDLSGGGWKRLASQAAERLLSNTLGTYTHWVLKAKDAVVRLADSRRHAAKAKPLARAGRTIVYPGAASPRFLLSEAAFSIAERDELPGISAAVRDITSDPDILGRPIAFEASAEKEVQSLSLRGTIDARAGRKTDAEMSLAAGSWGLAISEGLEAVSVSSLKATADLGLDMRFPAGAGPEGEGSVVLDRITLQPLATGDAVGEAVAASLASARNARIDFGFSQPEGGAPLVSVRTNLDEVLSGAVKAQAARLAGEYEGRIREELEKKLQGDLERNEALSSALAGFEKTALTDLAAAGSYQKVLVDARTSLEKKLKSAVPLPKLGF
jgi:uncharacterized protein (TIGR03545 family)